VLLAIEEGATNIIRHAYLYEKGTLRLRIIIYKKLIVFSLIDSGRSFHPENSGKINLDRLVESGRKGGLGFYMIQKIMDSVEYISAAGFNELRMIKRVRGTSRETQPFLRRLFTLRVKFSIWTFLIVSLIIGGAFLYSNQRTKIEVYNHLDETVDALAATVATQAAGYMINRRSDVEFDELVVSYRRSNSLIQRLVITDTTGTILAHSEDILNIRKPYRPPSYVNPVEVGVTQRIEVNGKQINYRVVPIKTGDKLLGMVYVTYSSEPIYHKLADAREKILLLTAGLLLIGIVGIYLLSSYFVAPIVKITRRVRQFTSGDLETELPLEGADEFFEISRAFNDMITRLSRDRRNVIEREKMAKEIEVASEIQKTLLPREVPQLPGLELDAYYRAASMVGGDLYDIFEIGDDRYCLVVADVSGKGVPASLVMSMLRTVFQIHSRNAVSAKDTLLKVNDYLLRNIPPGMFITVFLAIYDAGDQRLSLVSAGHNPMLYYRGKTSQLVTINPSGMPLGVPSTLNGGFDERLEEVNLKLDEGDIFFIYTDGVTEATNRDGRQYGQERLMSFFEGQLNGDGTASVSSLSEAIVNEIDSFSGFAKQNDDITFILAKTTSTGIESSGEVIAADEETPDSPQ
jgi:serine phosphatase RsbU (regulator of sigma subunit)/uncharacterized membrane protein affecting hemolysin expression